MRRWRCRQTEFRRLRHGRIHIVNAEAEVMQTWTVIREPGVQRMFGRKRLDQLQMRVADVQVSETNSAVVDLLSIGHGKTKPVAPDFQRGFGVGDDDSDVIEAAPRELRIEN